MWQVSYLFAMLRAKICCFAYLFYSNGNYGTNWCYFNILRKYFLRIYYKFLKIYLGKYNIGIKDLSLMSLKEDIIKINLKYIHLY